MAVLRQIVSLSVLAGLLAAGGCAWVPKSRLAASEAKNQSLVSQNRAYLEQIYSLKTHARDVEDQLGDAEQQLAALDQRYGSDRRRLDSFRRERDAVRGYLNGLGRERVAIPGHLHARLEDLARRYPNLHYDSASGVAKLDTNVLFDTGRAELRPVATQLLSEFAEVFRQPDARDLKVMVVGHTDDRNIVGSELRQRYPNNFHLSSARSLAVVDFLHRAGIEEERLGTSGFGRHQPIVANSDSPTRQRNRRVEIFIVAPEVPIVGWTETTPQLY